ILADLETRHGFVAAVLPQVESAPAVAVLAPERPVVVVVRAGEVERDSLQRAVEACERLGATVAGIVLQPPKKGRRA
ncbi:MAG TPA: hypothetical protein VGR37_03825, partial [Longimicrobiaceae bacterium]|nr:hypothetical protein [Longimicrobiaceae bacterium]